MENICRLCCSQSAPLIPAFRLKNGRVIADLVTIICPVRIELDDNLPQSVCVPCINIIFDAVSLREKSLENDQNLRSSIGAPVQKKKTIKTEENPLNEEIWLEDGFFDQNQEDSIQSEYEEERESVQSPKVSDKTPRLTIQSKPQCNLCGVQMSHVSNVKRHMQRYHHPSLEHACEECTCRFNTEAKLQSHVLKTHTFPRMVPKKLTKGETSIDPAIHDSNLCDFCGKDFENRSLLERHLTIVHKRKNKVSLENESSFLLGCYPCSLCERTFTLRHNLMRHYKRFHSPALTFECNQCNDRFKKKILLDRHQYREHNNYNGVFNKTSALSKKGSKEEDICDDIPESCEHCEEEFNGSRCRYERHMINKHEKEVSKVYTCDICQKKFIFIKSLKFHVNQHKKRAREENFLFKCDQCYRKFFSEEKYNQHV